MERKGQKRFQGKTVLVTGGSSGIGEGIAKRFLAEGAEVIVFDIRKPDYEVVYCEVDVRDEQRIKDALKRVVDLDILVNNAGIYVQGNIEKLEEKDIDAIFDTNLKGAILMCKHAMPLLKKGKGQIVNISSTLAFTPRAENFLYPMTKGDLVLLTQALAQDYPNTHVRVNAISPGPIKETNIHPDMDWSSEERVRKEIEKRNVPMGRYGTVEEVASLVAYVCSSESEYINGVSLVIDGGRGAF